MVSKMMKHGVVLNVNFLNILNQQNFPETYREGRGAAEEWDGSSSLTINVENLKYISDAALKKCNYVVIDEIQKLYQDDYRRTSCGDKLIEQIKRIQGLRVPLLVMSGTPVVGVKFRQELGFSLLKVNKQVVTEKDDYNVTFCEGLTAFNVAKKVKELVDSGETVVILSNLHRHIIGKHLTQEGINYEDVLSDDKTVQNTATNYIMKNQVLPEDVNVYLSTSVLQEGVNLKDGPERPITFITFLDDIKTPNQAVQFAGRAREQRKKLIIGYRNGEDFEISSSKVVYDHSGALDSSFSEYAKANFDHFKSIKDWAMYFRKAVEGKLDFKYSAFLEKSVKGKEKLNVDEILGLLGKAPILKPSGVSFADYFKVHGKGTQAAAKIIDNPNGKGVNMWMKTGNCTLVRNLLRALDYGFDLTDMEELELKTLAGMINFSGIFTKLTVKMDPESTLFSDLAFNTYGGKRISEEFKSKFKEYFKVSRVKNGEVSELEETEAKYKEMVDKPLEMMDQFTETFSEIIRRRISGLNICGVNMPLLYAVNPFGGETLVDKFKKEFAAVKAAAAKKKQATSSARKTAGSKTKKVVLENIQTGEKMEFSSSKECDVYVRDKVNGLGFSDSEMKALRKGEVKGFKRVKE